MDRTEPIPTSLIDKGKRFREDYKDIPQLAHSIEEKGLIQPIAVQQKGGRYLLLAGGRRLLAHQYLKQKMIMCRIYDEDLSDLQVRAIELAENVDREDLTYIERINLEKEIHELYLKIHGPKISTKPDAPGHSMADTAKLLNKTPASITMDMKIAKAMEEFPQLQWDRMKNRQEALKVVEKIGTSLHRAECAKIAEAQLGKGESFKRKMCDSFIIGDFFEQAKCLPDNYFDIVEVDPPYAIDLTRKKKGYSYEGYNEVPKENYLDFIAKTIEIAYAKMVENSWIIFWFGPDPWYQPIGDLLVQKGFNTTGLVGLWVKGVDSGEGISAGGQTHMPNSRLANAYEMFYYAWKGSPILASPGRSNVFGYKPLAPGKKGHPTERPIELMSDVLGTFGVENSRVLVPFAGSGNTLIAAAKGKMVPVGFDLSQNYKDSYILRIEKEF